jgi:hypothetical protein
VVCDGLPYNGLINNIITVDQDISEPYDAVMLGNLFQQFVICILNPIRSFSDDLKVSFNRSFGDRFVLCLEIHSTDKILYLFGCLKDVNEVFSCFIVHK